MYRIKSLKILFLLLFPCLVCRAETCPFDQVCTGDIVLITIQNDWSSLNRTLIGTNILVTKNPKDLSKGYFRVESAEPGFNGFYYRVQPGKTYFFDATYLYKDEGDNKLKRLFKHFYYKSRGDAHNPDAGIEGPISPGDAKAMGLPPIPKCTSSESPGEFCTNQVVHVFWNNSDPVRWVIDVDLFVDGQFVEHGHGTSLYVVNFHDYYYTLPDSKYNGEPVSFQVKRKIMNTSTLNEHFENSQILESRYTPKSAYACKPADSWEKCQYRPQED